MNEVAQSEQVVYALPLEDYHSDYKSHIGNSQLKDMAKTMAHFNYNLHNPEVFSATKQANFDWGNLFHWAALEPDLVEQRAVQIPLDYLTAIEGWKTAKDAKEEIAAWKAEHPGKLYMKPSAWEGAHWAAANVRKHPAAELLLNRGRAEVSMFSIMNGIPTKVRPDFLPEGRRIVVDLKSDANPAPVAFKKKIFDMGYFRGAAYYLDNVTQVFNELYLDYVWIVADKTPPHPVVVFHADAEDLTLGRKSYQELLERYSYCLENDVWPGYNDEDVVEVEMPQWAKNQIIE
jgi:hypothetical protein